MTPRIDGNPPASERLLSPRWYLTLEQAEADLDEARRLIRLGCPVGVARPALGRNGTWDPSWGTGGTGYWIPEGWEDTSVDLGTLDRYRWGDALFMVTGHRLDVLDIDPRNGGDDDLAELERRGIIPPVVARAATPSGGQHLYVAPLGVRKTKRGGVDLQAGDTDGQGRGFVFLPGTVRRSKGDGQLRPYRWVQPLTSAGVKRTASAADALIDWFQQATPNTSRAEERLWNGDTAAWLSAHTTGATLSHQVARAVKPFVDGEPFNGHERMLKFQIHLVRLAAEGRSGVPEALAYAREVWLASPHASAEDPAAEWDTGLDRAVRKYGGTP